MLGNFNDEAQFIILKAREEMLELNHPYIGSEHLLLSILKNNQPLSNKLNKYGLTYQNFKEEIINIIGKGTKKTEFFLYTPLLKKVIENSMLDAKDNNNGEVTPTHLLSSLLEEGEGIAIRIIVGMNIDIDELYEEFNSNIRVKNHNKKNKKLLIDDLGINLVDEAKKNKLDPVEGREKEINRLIEILLRRRKNNPLLIGEAGVGKTAIVEWLAYLIANKEVPQKLQNKKIISLDMATLVAGTKYRGEFEERLQKIIKEISNDGDIILFIDEIHTLVGAGGAEGAIDASNILKPALARGKVKCIGATTTKEYKKYIYNDKALSRRFEPITINEPTKEETIKILKKIKPIYEDYHNVIIKNEIINYIVELADKYIYNRKNPDKSIDILDEVCSKANIKDNPELKNIELLKNKLEKVSQNKNSLILENKIDKAYSYRKEESKIKSNINKLELNYNKKKNTITKEDVRIIISEKTNIPLSNIKNNNIENLKKELNNIIIGEKEAIDILINNTKKDKLGYSNNKVRSYLFVGPTGVGKTELAKQYSNLLIGENKLIRLDMSEYSDQTSINKIIGSSPGYVGYSDNNNILEKIKDNPTSVILLDEIDKAHPQVINLLYQMLDESQIKDSNNNIVKLNNNTIIMTTNIGYQNNSVGFTNNEEKASLKEVFNPSLINRIDNIITFKKLSKENITTIIKNKLNSLQSKYKDFTYNKKLIEEIINESEYNEYGARKLNKIIEGKLENIIIDNIINNKEPYIISLKEYITS